MPWQQDVADVALEVDPVTGLLVYRKVVVTVPRQSGKTTLLLSVMVQRANAWVRQRIKYTAQSRNDARAKWEDEHLPLLEDSPFAGRYRVRKTNGSEAIKWQNGSIHGLVAAKKTSGHGNVLDLGVIDEAFAQVDYRLEQAMSPAMITRPQPQLWVVSTAGDDESVYLWNQVELGRARAEAGLQSGVCYFEWSADDDDDAGDPATWAKCMPALGHTQTIEAVRGEYESMPLPEFDRAYLNRWRKGKADDPVVPLPRWAQLLDEGSEIVGPPVLVFDVNPEQSHATIAAVGRRADGKVHLEVIDHRSGTGWVVDRLVQLKARHKPAAIWADYKSTAGTLAAAAEKRKLGVRPIEGAELAKACGRFVAATLDGDLCHLGQPELLAAITGARKRPLGDAFAWSRRRSDVDISPLVAVTIGLFAIEAGPAKKPVFAH